MIGAEGIIPTLDEIDVVIDATANRGVAAALDRFAAARSTHPAVISVVTDARCELTAMFATPPTGVGPGYSARAAFRRLQRHPAKARLIDAFWGSPDIADLVQPEPGCSAPTFHGSAADAASAASTLVNQIGRYLADQANHLAVFTALPHAEPLPGQQPLEIETPMATRVRTNDTDEYYAVLLTESARATIHEIVSRTFDALQPNETGGLLFGERDDAARTITIDDASGPPPDSTHSPTGFVRGTSGVDDSLKGLGYGSALNRSTYLGDWHSHPNGTAELSPTDRQAVTGLRDDGASLLLIWAGTPQAAGYVAEIFCPEIRPGQPSVSEPDSARRNASHHADSHGRGERVGLHTSDFDAPMAP